MILTTKTQRHEERDKEQRTREKLKGKKNETSMPVQSCTLNLLFLMLANNYIPKLNLE